MDSPTGATSPRRLSGGGMQTEKKVCPNDRHLALRAKLKLGWSTGKSLPVHQDSLSEEETKAILEVVQKAEQMEMEEQERIGRLVQKVNAMKTKLAGNGTTTCILCGENLPVIRTSNVECSGCNKGVCSKCGLETFTGQGSVWLCRVCSETREMWKRSGAWFYRGLPKHVVPSGSSSAPTSRRIRGLPRRAITLAMRGASTDPESDASSEDEKTRRRRLTKAPSECGGYYEGGTPPISVSPRPRTASPSPLKFDFSEAENKTTSPISPRPGPSSSEKTPLKSPISPASEQGVSRDSGSDSPGGLLTPHYTPSPLSPGAKSESRRDHSAERSPSPLLRVAWRDSSSRGSNSSYGDSPSACRDDADVQSARTTPSPLPFKHQEGGAVNGISSRRDSSASRKSPKLSQSAPSSKDSKDSYMSLDSLTSQDFPSKDNGNCCSSQDEVFPEDDELEFPCMKDSKLGSLEFSLLYDSHNFCLHCTIHGAKNLHCSDSNATADPYVKLHLLPGASKSNKLRTKTIQRTLNPEFNETLTYYGISETDMRIKTIRLTVMDEDRFSHEFMGEARVVLRKIPPHETRRVIVPLDKKTTLAEDEMKNEDERGRILLSLKYSTFKSALIVGIVRCSHLPSCDSNGFSDPYVKVHLRPDPRNKKFRTAVKWKNLNPEFNEEFLFEVKRSDLPRRLLDIRVFDKDVGRSDDFIGGLQLSQDSTGSELRHWYDAIQYPDRRHDRWHQLRLL